MKVAALLLYNIAYLHVNAIAISTGNASDYLRGTVDKDAIVDSVVTAAFVVGVTVVVSTTFCEVVVAGFVPIAVVVAVKKQSKSDHIHMCTIRVLIASIEIIRLKSLNEVSVDLSQPLSATTF